jgi:hypothetical protein
VTAARAGRSSGRTYLFNKKSSKKWRVFQPRKTTIQNTTFTTQATTITPPKNHHQTHTFSKTPLKTPAKTAKPRLSPGLHFFSETTS